MRRKSSPVTAGPHAGQQQQRRRRRTNHNGERARHTEQPSPQRQQSSRDQTPPLLKPTDKVEADVELSTGNYGYARNAIYTASVKLPLIKGKLFFGAALLYEGMNGFYTNDFNNTHFDKQHRFGGNYYLKYLIINSKWMATA